MINILPFTKIAKVQVEEFEDSWQSWLIPMDIFVLKSL